MKFSHRSCRGCIILSCGCFQTCCYRIKFYCFHCVHPRIQFLTARSALTTHCTCACTSNRSHSGIGYQLRQQSSNQNLLPIVRDDAAKHLSQCQNCCKVQRTRELRPLSLAYTRLVYSISRLWFSRFVRSLLIMCILATYEACGSMYD